LLAERLDEAVRKVRDVAFPLSQARKSDPDDFEAVQEVFAKLTGLGLRVQILVRRGYDSHIDGEILASAQAPKTPLLDEREELGLRRRSRIPDLVEKERAAVGGLGEALAGLARIGERAALMSE
jgi:hypothetical protein